MLFLLLVINSNKSFSQDYGVSWKPFFLPFEIKLGTNGISINGESSIVTPIGNVGVWADVNISDRPVKINNTIIEKRDLIVIIRDVWTKDGDYLFKIKDGVNLTVVLDGLNEISCNNGKVVIDVSEGNIKSIKFKGETTYYDSKILNFNKLYNTEFRHQFGKNFKKTYKYRNATYKYSISENLIENDPALIYLIVNTESMDENEKQYWFNLYNKMNYSQIERLYDILIREVIKLTEIDKKYGIRNNKNNNFTKEEVDLPKNFEPIIYIDGYPFNINEIYQNTKVRDLFDDRFKYTQQFKNAINRFSIPTYAVKYDKFLIYLIVNSESMDNSEKQYWFNLLETMNLQQVEKLYEILINEKIKLLTIEAKYKK